jgi:hypothetical protein
VFPPVDPNAPVPVPNFTTPPAAIVIGPNNVAALSVPKISVPVPVFVSPTPPAEFTTPNVKSPNPPTDAFEPNVNAPLKLAAPGLLFHNAALKSYDAVFPTPNPLIVTLPRTPVRPFKSNVPELRAVNAVPVPVVVTGCDNVTCVALSTLTMYVPA